MVYGQNKEWKEVKQRYSGRMIELRSSRLNVCHRFWFLFPFFLSNVLLIRSII